MSEIFKINEKQSISARYASTSRKYVAYKTVDTIIHRVKIRPKARAWERLHYSHLHRIVENGYGTELGLVFGFALVIIKGVNLQIVGDALDRHECDFLQEFDESIWDRPSDITEPFIEEMAITVETREDIVRASDKMLAEMVKSKN